MGKVKKTVLLEDKVITFYWEDFDGDIDVDDMTKIHYDNLFGDAVTVSTVLNRIGLLRNEAENIMNILDRETKILESNIDEKLRKEALRKGEKLTEKQIDRKIITDNKYSLKKKEYLTAKKNFKNLETIYWGIQSKDKKLELLIKGTTPKEFEDGIIDGIINGILINKKNRKFKN